jgi:hypothetical protein
LEGWLVASKGLVPLPRRRASALAHGSGRGGRVLLPPGEGGRRVNRLEVTGCAVQAGWRTPVAVGARAIVVPWLGLGLEIGSG